MSFLLSDKIKKMKWLSALFSAVFIGVFEFVRHRFLDVISMSWGNVLVAGVTGILFVLYFHGIFSLLESVSSKLQREKEETAVLQERERIARELHDSVAQSLFFMNIKALEIEKALHHQPLTAVKELQEAIKMTDADIRQHIFALQRVTPETINLVATIQEQLTAYERHSNSKVHLCITGDIDTKLGNVLKKKLLPIFQELLQNIRKHAEAKQVNVSLGENGRQFTMTVQDNGKGFSIEAARARPSSFGLKHLEEDIRAMGANLNLQSVPGEGTTVNILLDLKEGG